MDRGGGSGRGGPSRQGSSLPRTLHGSLLHTDTGEEGDVFAEEPQAVEALEAGQDEPPPYPVYVPSTTRPASVPYSTAAVPGPSSFPTFEQGSSRGPGELSRAYPYSIETHAEQQQPPRVRQERNLALPPFRTQAAPSTDPELYASSVAASRLNFNYASPAPPPPGRPSLPPVSSLDSALGTTSYAGSSAQEYYSTPRGNTWDTAPNPYVTERPMARTAWSYPGLSEHSPPTRTYPAPSEISGYSEIARWGQYTRAENFSQEEGRSTAAHLSAARSTILESQQLSDQARAARLYQPQPQVPMQPSQIPVPSVELAQPFYEIAEAREGYSQVSSEFSPAYSGRTRETTSPSASDASPLAHRGRTTSTSAPLGWQEPRRAEIGEQPLASTSAAQRPSSTQLGKRKASDHDDDSSEDSPVRKVPKKTPIACNFCRGRKLKCDGRTPACGHCEKRRQPCTYVDAVKRRGPGKAPKGHRKSQQQKPDRSKSAAQGPAQAGPSSSPASARQSQPLPASVSPENPYTRYQGMYLSTAPVATQAGPAMGSLPSRIPVQPPYPSTQFEFTYPAPRQATSTGARAAYERTTFSDDFGLPQQLPYPAAGSSQVQTHAFEPPRVQSTPQLQAGWPAAASSESPATSSAAAAVHDHDDERGSRARELHEAEYPYDTPAGSARAPGPGRER